MFPSHSDITEDATPTSLDGERVLGEQEESGLKKVSSESTLKDEFESMDVGDTSSFLETLDSEVSMMVSDAMMSTHSESNSTKPILFLL